MSTWRYQVRKRIFATGPWYDIVEMYTNPRGWTKDACAPGGDSLEELQQELVLMQDCLQDEIFEEPHETTTTK